MAKKKVPVTDPLEDEVVQSDDEPQLEDPAQDYVEVAPELLSPKTFNTKAILREVQNLLKFTHPSITAHDPSPLEARKERMRSALQGFTPEEVCSNDPAMAEAFHAVVGVLSEAWGGGTPPHMLR